MAANPKCCICGQHNYLTPYTHRVGAVRVRVVLCRICSADILINTNSILAERNVGKFKGITISRGLVEAIDDQVAGERDLAENRKAS